MLKIVDLAHVMFNVTDLDRAIHFYRDLLGLMPRYGVYSMELSPDREWLYYSCLTGRTLYRRRSGCASSMPSAGGAYG